MIIIVLFMCLGAFKSAYKCVVVVRVGAMVRIKTSAKTVREMVNV